MADVVAFAHAISITGRAICCRDARRVAKQDARARVSTRFAATLCERSRKGYLKTRAAL